MLPALAGRKMLNFASNPPSAADYRNRRFIKMLVPRDIGLTLNLYLVKVPSKCLFEEIIWRMSVMVVEAQVSSLKPFYLI